MQISESRYSIAEVLDMLRRKALTVNDEYQRAGRLWPPAARSYFIDTILSGFPFPKIFFWERLADRRPHREVVDGQQRILSILDFSEDKFALGGNSNAFEGKKFSNLSDEEKESFLSYTISVDVIRNAQRSDILQMFRRMNAYTLPLNDAEKRHSEFFGLFKDWTTRLVDSWGPLLADWKVLSSRSIVRMEDAAMFGEIALVLRTGVVSSSDKQLRQLYIDFDESFPEGDAWADQINEVLQFVQSRLSQIQSSFMTKSYAFLSLITALLHNRWGLPNFENETGIAPTGRFCIDPDQATANLLALAAAHEAKDLHGRYRAYVEACKGGSNRVRQRRERTVMICRALNNSL